MFSTSKLNSSQKFVRWEINGISKLDSNHKNIIKTSPKHLMELNNFQKKKEYEKVKRHQKSKLS
jgi:hypothetical protein